MKHSAIFQSTPKYSKLSALKENYSKNVKDADLLNLPRIARSASTGRLKPDDLSSRSVDGRASLFRPNLQLSEKEFLSYVTKGDLEKAKQLLEAVPDLDVNCVDFQGASALHIALKRDDDEMVDFLLSKRSLDVMDCVLHAIKLNQPKNVRKILDRLLMYPNPPLEYAPCINSAEFPDYMTPMMLAAQCGFVEIIKLLFQRDHPEIPTPHETRCACAECMKTLKEKDPLTVSTRKFEVYKALCNPAYICHVSKDPILMVFYLVSELREMALRYRVYLRKYEGLIEETQKFAAELIGNCRSSEEVTIILSETAGSNLRGEFLFPRLIIAMDFRQQYFVAQTNVQEVLENAWVGDWYEWSGYSDKRRAVHFLGRIFMLPVLYVVCIFFPNSYWAKFYSIPLNRMLSSVASYFIFLCLLFWESDRDKKDQTRYEIQYHTGWQVLIFIFVISHIVNSLRMWTLQGTHRFLAFKWNLYDLATEVMFALTFAFWVSALVTMGWQPDLPRKLWHYLDPQLLAEGFFCIGTVMSFTRLLLLIQVHHTLGPMQVSLGKMTNDFSQFIIIFAIVIGSFTAGMCKLYQYYDGMKQIDPETNSESRQESSFVSTYDTFKVLFWGLFCMSSQDAGSVVIENLPSEGGELESLNSHEFTQAVGYCLFGVYTVLTVIVLLNMLIAAMSNTFQRVTENVDVEWIFGRTEVYLAYMSQTVLPPPLSFIPAGVGVNACTGLFSGAFQKWFSRASPEAKEPAAAEDFDRVMRNLVLRYFTQTYEEEKLDI